MRRVWKVCLKCRGRFFSAVVGRKDCGSWAQLKAWRRQYSFCRAVPTSMAFGSLRSARGFASLSPVRDCRIGRLVILKATCASAKRVRSLALPNAADFRAFAAANGKPNGWDGLDVDDPGTVLYCRNLRVVEEVKS